jgi:hypothetical protein
VGPATWGDTQGALSLNGGDVVAESGNQLSKGMNDPLPWCERTSGFFIAPASRGKSERIPAMP